MYCCLAPVRQFLIQLSQCAHVALVVALVSYILSTSFCNSVVAQQVCTCDVVWCRLLLLFCEQQLLSNAYIIESFRSFHDQVIQGKLWYSFQSTNTVAMLYFVENKFCWHVLLLSVVLLLQHLSNFDLSCCCLSVASIANDAMQL